jgi:hypothetical protein
LLPLLAALAAEVLLGALAFVGVAIVRERLAGRQSEAVATGDPEQDDVAGVTAGNDETDETDATDEADHTVGAGAAVATVVAVAAAEAADAADLKESTAQTPKDSSAPVVS